MAMIEYRNLWPSQFSFPVYDFLDLIFKGVDVTKKNCQQMFVRELLHIVS